MIHVLKTMPKYFDAQLNGVKPFEVRRHDRDFSVGDSLKLVEYQPDVTGEVRIVWRVVTYILTHEMFPEGVAHGYCVLGTRADEKGGN